MGTRSGSGGILGWEKSGGDYDEEQQEEQEECDVGLGLRMQLNENNSDTTSSSSSSVFPNRKAAAGVSLHGTATASPHHHHPYHHYLTGDYVGGGGSVYGSTSNISQIPYMGLSGSGDSASILQSPDCFASAGSSATKAAKSLQHHPLNISGKMVASANVRVPFTAAQWQELERQNMILKYMMASVPVPPELLSTSTTKSFSNIVPPSRGGCDPEPWRCRRTDGKKWRCSRDVAPHQKYCERHSHKNRPRSRKPVELPPAAADYLLNPTAKSSSALKRSLASKPQHQHRQPPVDSRQAPSSHFITPFDQDTPSGLPSSQPFDHLRSLDWFMKGETIPSQEWHPHEHPRDDISMGLKDSVMGYRRNNGCSGSGGGSSGNIDPFQPKQASQYSAMPQDCGLLLMEGVVDPCCGQQTRRFIDAWSDVDEGGGNRAVSSYNASSGKNFDLPTSSLTLTMCGGEGEEYSLGSHRMGEKPRWMSGGMGHHGSWMGSPPGGPLAEALCLGSIGGGGCVRYGTSPRGCSSVTTTATSSRSSSKEEGQEELNFIE